LVTNEEEPVKKRKLRDACEAYERVICKALAEIGKELYHFNFSREVIKYVLRFAYKRDERIRSIVEDLIRFFMESDNPSTYTFKLLIMEHFAKLFKQRKFVVSLHENIFSSITCLYVDDSAKDMVKKQKSEDNLDEKISQLREKQKKKKLNKSGEKMLKKLEDDRRRRDERRKKRGTDDSRIQKALKKDLAESEAIIDPVKVAKLVTSNK
jgi:hypothetical protein